MSRLYLGTDPETLAHHLGQALEDHLRAGDAFKPTTIVVPNPYLGKWLRLYLARRLGVAINLRFLFIEQVLWNLLRQTDQRDHPCPPEMLGGDLYRFLVLSVLLGHDGPELDYLRHYVKRADKDSPPAWRRTWNLADRFSSLIRDYEYHRREELILPWVYGDREKINLADSDFPLERSQRTLFYQIIREPDGKRALLNAASERNFKTLPQYYGEVLDGPRPVPKPPLEPVYLFGITQLSGLHLQALSFLASYFDLRFYFLSPFTRLLQTGSGITIGEKLKAFSNDPNPRESLPRRWGIAGLESLKLLEGLMRPGGPMDWEVLPEGIPPALPKSQGTKRKPSSRKKIVDVEKRRESVLSRLQATLLGTIPEGTELSRLPQDCSLQVVGCPGVQREVETVYQSILDNLQKDKDLRLTDIAVLVSDMKTYRPTLQAVFEREPGRLGYSLVDHSASGVSLWGQALLGMLDLAQDNFARSLVFEVVLNPCVLARLGVGRAEAQAWLQWAEDLGAHHGWDQKERAERGHAQVELFAWKQALQRLRLGRYMETEADPFQPRPLFSYLVPHADLNSGDRYQLDAFCRAIEGLLPLLIRLRSSRENGRWWANTLRDLARHFLEVPEDRPAEARVRDQLLGALEQLELWDQIHRDRPRDAKVPLALVRQFLQSSLEGISASRGDYLVSGVTISALQPMRPVPFRVVYVLGLNELLFPGSNSLSSMDLRGHDRIPGDVWPAEQNLYLLLEVLLATRSKVYLLFNDLELQKDRELLPAVPLVQLQQYLKEHILTGGFVPVKMPLHAHDPRYFGEESRKPHQDVLVQYGAFSRALALQEGEEAGLLHLSQAQKKELEDWRQKRRRDLAEAAPIPPEEGTPRVRVKHLRDFLYNPAKAFLEGRLSLEREQWDEDHPDEEPFYSDRLRTQSILYQVMREVIRRQVRGDLPPDETAWADWIDPVHEDLRLRCQAPSGPFGDVDRQHLKDTFHEQVQGDDGLKAFLNQHDPADFCGPILLGDSSFPIGARLHFPALKLRLPSAGEVSLVGHWDLVWHRPGQSFEILLFSYAKKFKADGKLSRQAVEPILFCLALLAQQGMDRLGTSSRQMLQGIPWNIHQMTTGGLVSWTFPADCILPGEAEEYLQALVVDYFDPGAFELLPLEVILDDKELHEAVLGKEATLSPDAFATLFQEKLEGGRDFQLKSWDSELIQLLDPPLAKDALAKARRRLRLLDRGPALMRAEEDSKKNDASGKAAKTRGRRSKETVE